MAMLGRGTGKAMMAGFSAWAITHGIDRYFETDLTGFVDEKSGGFFSKIKDGVSS
jgi:hypothetical protein